MGKKIISGEGRSTKVLTHTNYRFRLVLSPPPTDTKIHSFRVTINISLPPPMTCLPQHGLWEAGKAKSLKNWSKSYGTQKSHISNINFYDSHVLSHLRLGKFFPLYSPMYPWQSEQTIFTIFVFTRWDFKRNCRTLCNPPTAPFPFKPHPQTGLVVLQKEGKTLSWWKPRGWNIYHD